MLENRQVCFVIMPFSKTAEKHTKNYWTEHFNSYLKPLIEENSAFEAQRSKPLRGDLLREIITALVTSQVVVADLTDQNPNVYWELGVRQSFRHGTVTIAEVGTKRPFDVSTKAILYYYPKDHLKDVGFRDRFKEAIQDCLVNPAMPDSHVRETLFGHGTLFEIFHRDEAIRRLDAVLSECENNLSWITKVVRTAQENREKKYEERIFATERLEVSAIRLLTTNRYVDEDETFYKPAEVCLMWLNTMNVLLDKWSLPHSKANEWLLSHTEKAQKWVKKFEVQVSAARKKLNRPF